MYVVLGATGNTGSIIANSLLTKGERVRVVGRDASRLARFVRKGAEAFTANVTDAAALTKVLSGARAAYLLLPPSLTSLDYRADQERESDSIAKAVRESDLRYAVLLSSFGAHVPEGTGLIAGMGMFGHALLPDLKIPMIATRDIGDYAAERILKLDFAGKQTRELLGERDLTMTEVTAIIARCISTPDLRYVQS